MDVVLAGRQVWRRQPKFRQPRTVGTTANDRRFVGPSQHFVGIDRILNRSRFLGQSVRHVAILLNDLHIDLRVGICRRDLVGDLLQYSGMIRQLGGINRIVPVLSEHGEELRIPALLACAKAQKMPTLQRLGFLLSALGFERQANALRKHLPLASMRPVQLSLAHAAQPVRDNNPWLVVVNNDLDLE